MPSYTKIEKTGNNVYEITLNGEQVGTVSDTKDADSLGCAKLVVFCNAPDDNPFMAGAFHGVTEADAMQSFLCQGVKHILHSLPERMRSLPI